MGIALWALYCKKQPPIIRKPAVYAAALEYFLHKWFKPWDASTQADIARKYGVSVGNVSARYGDMEVVLAEELDEFLKEVYEAPEDTGKLLPSPPSRMSQEQLLWDIKALAEEREFDSVEELNRYINAEINRPSGLKKTNSNAKQVQARELLYQAWDEAGSKRYELARRALELYPNSPDAYVILSEQAASTEAAKSLLYQGIKAGVEDLGQAYFEENKGHFWGLLETRPFMRVKLNYAFCLWNLGEHAEAIRHYEELLSLNPNDNQGVRYELLPAYIETGRYREARELIGKYHDGTANILFNQVLLEYLTSGVTEKTSRHLQEAVNQNPHVMKYLLKKKRIPRERPEYIGIGDELEAIAYVQEHARLWWREHALMDFIRRFDRGQARL
jgi:tetratricopeptide (TPR) repeat protein